MSETTNTQTYPVWGAIATLAWGALIAISFALIQLVVSFIYIGLQSNDPANIPDDIGYNGDLIAFATISTFVFCSSLIIGIITLKKGAIINDYLGLTPVSLLTLLKWMVLLVVIVIGIDSLTYALGKPIIPEFMVKAYGSSSNLVLFAFAIVIAAPIFEELFFRGFLITGLQSSYVGPYGAITLTSMIWASIHLQYDFYYICIIFVFGLVLGLARLQTNSLYVPIMMHALNNFLSFILAAIFAK